MRHNKAPKTTSSPASISDLRTTQRCCSRLGFSFETPYPVGCFVDHPRGFLMHIEQVQFRGNSLRQALVRFPRVPAIDSWWSLYQHKIAAAAGLENVSTAYRLMVRADGSIDRIVSAVLAPDKERSARRFFGGMVLLEAFGQR